MKPSFIAKTHSRSIYRSLLWFIPFICFAFGYIIIGYVLHKTNLETPNVIGKSLQEGVFLLSQHHLGIRLLQEREDPMLPEGTIIDQLPHAKQKIRPNQTVFVILSTKQHQMQMPDLWGKRHKEVMEIAAKKGFDLTQVNLLTNYPMGMCIAHYPPAASELINKRALVYISDGKPMVFIMPNFRGATINEIEEALRQFNIRAEIFHVEPHLNSPEHVCTSCKIVDQQPTAGAIIDLSGKLHIQFRVSAS